jgi:SNF2 family DNA or RNA helicase
MPTGLNIELSISHEDGSLFDSDTSPPGAHADTLRALRLHAGKPSKELQSLTHLDEEAVKLLEHQVDAAYRALFEMDGKALLADEVGLGKTIEVGMILKEMHYRASNNSILILTPAQLAKQWQAEMAEKFGLNFVCNYDDEFEGFDAHNQIIASIDTAKSDRYREAVLNRRWDVLVLDEAHYVKNEETDRYDLIENLQYNYAFFLTATPIQNELTDLYNIVSLLRPGLFGSRDVFHNYFVDDSQDTLVNRDTLQERLQEVMVRNRRAETDIDFTERNIYTRSFEPTDAELELYDALTNYVRSRYSKSEGQHLVLTTLQKEVVSSPYALEQTIDKQLNEQGELTFAEDLQAIQDKIDAIDTVTKIDRLEDIVEEARDHVPKGRVIVFTQFLPTLWAVIGRLDELGYKTHAFHGGLSSSEKEDVVDDFRENGGILVSTDAMNEGRNLQFCNVMVNYDLPWNPMKVEQRIGRIHRIGQKREVYVFNMALEDTIEEYVLEKLFDKIDLFQQTVGELSAVLTRLEGDDRSFEDEVFERLMHADSEVDLENDFEDMAIDLEEQQDLAEKLHEFNNGVFEGFDLGTTDA